MEPSRYAILMLMKYSLGYSVPSLTTRARAPLDTVMDDGMFACHFMISTSNYPNTVMYRPTFLRTLTGFYVVMLAHTFTHICMYMYTLLTLEPEGIGQYQSPSLGLDFSCRWSSLPSAKNSFSPATQLLQVCLSVPFPQGVMLQFEFSLGIF